MLVYMHMFNYKKLLDFHSVCVSVYIMLPEYYSVHKNAENGIVLLWISSFVLVIFRALRRQCAKAKFPRFFCYHWFSLAYKNY